MTRAVLILRALGLGDFLTAVPAYRGLRGAFPGHRLVLAAPAPLEPLLPLVGALDRLLPCGELEPVPWAGPAPELAVNLHGRGPRSHRVLAGLGADRTVGFRHPEVPDVDGPEWTAGEHEVRRWCRLLESAGIGCDPTDLLIDAPPGAFTGAVVIHPGAAAPARRWAPDRYAAVAGALAAGGRPVLVTGSAAERRIAESVAARAGLPAAAVLAGHTGLAALAGVVAHAALLVCGDTGVAHLATALGTPSVLLFGPTPPAQWGPLRDPDRHTVLWDGAAGDPHGDQMHPGLAAIGVPAVLAAARALLAAASTPAGPTARTAPGTA
jgi:ADP-heptose:LPS heptosyltransferase